MRKLVAISSLIAIVATIALTAQAWAFQVATSPETSPTRPEIDGKPIPPQVIKVLNKAAFSPALPVFQLLSTKAGKYLVSRTDEAVIIWDAATGSRVLKYTEANHSFVAVSAQEDLIAFGNDNQSIAVYELFTGKPRFTVERGQTRYGLLRTLAFSPDGTTLMSGAEDAIHFWSTTDGLATGALHLNSTLQGAVFSADGKTLFTAAMDGTIREWDLASQKERRIVLARPNWSFDSIALSEDGKALAYAAESYAPDAAKFRAVCLFDLAASKDRFVAKDTDMVLGDQVILSPEGRYIGTILRARIAGKSGLKLWDSWTGKDIRLPAVAGHEILSACILPVSSTLATGGTDGRIRIWSILDGEEDKVTRGQPAGMVRRIAFSPSGELVASADYYGNLHLWDARTGVIVRAIGEHKCAIDKVNISPLANALFTSCVDPLSREFEGYLWDIESGKQRSAALPPVDLISSVFSPDGQTAASRDAEHAVVIWDLESGAVRKRLRGHGDKPTSLAFSADGRLLASASADQSVRVWDVASGACLSTAPLRIERATSVRVWFSPDGSLLFTSFLRQETSSNFTLKFFIDVSETMTGSYVFNSPSIANPSGSGANIYSRKGVFPSHFVVDPIPPAACRLEDGRILLTTCEPGKFRLVDLLTGTSLGAEILYGGDFKTADFSPDGKVLALGYPDGRLILCEPPPLPTFEPLPQELTRDGLEELWRKLMGQDAQSAHQARWRLSAAKKQALALLRDRLVPVQPANGKQVEICITDLASASFKVRESATRELERFGDVAAAALKRALTLDPQPEPRQRIDRLLKNIAGPPTGETLRTLRAIVILEEIGSQEAQIILTNLAAGVPGAHVTEAAGAALQRLKKRGTS